MPKGYVAQPGPSFQYPVSRLDCFVPFPFQQNSGLKAQVHPHHIRSVSNSPIPDDHKAVRLSSPGARRFFEGEYAVFALHRAVKKR